MKIRDYSQDEGEFDEYFFEKNLQGDIIAVYNMDGEKIGTYTYDAWGNFTITLASTNTTAENNIVNTYNPYRYRGYYYDVETGLYYLQSRYYNPSWGRFINADAILNANGDLIGNNLFAYCSNNPVMFKDESGYFLDFVFDVVSLAFSVYDVCTNPSDPMAWLGLAADVACLAAPGLTGGGAAVKAISKADDIADACRTVNTVDNIADAAKAINKVDDVVDAAKAINKVDDVVDTGKTIQKIHANSLKTTKVTQGYILRNKGTHEILKYGETTRGVKRYTNKYLRKNNAYMDFVAIGTKLEMHHWQHDMIVNYVSISGQLPPLNKSFW